MSDITVVVGILCAIAIGAISPGPSFVLVSRVAIGTSRRDGLAAALGMGLGGMVFSTLALLGLTALLLQVEWLYLVLKLAGGAYLIYLGLRIVMGARAPMSVASATAPMEGSFRRSFMLGFLTQISNPKTAIVYASIFAAFLPVTPSLLLLLVLPPALFVIEAGWYAIVAYAFSAPAPRRAYLRLKFWIDAIAGLVMGALGARLIVDGVLSQRA